MHYTVYEIKNNVNGKVYVGKHQTTNLDDGYMGSGKLIKRAIRKYGIENFSKKILYTFTTEEEMNAKEAEIVTEEFCQNSYNLCRGGQGGFSYINRTVSPDQKQIRKAGKIQLQHFISDPVYRKNKLEKIAKTRSTPEFRQRMSEISKRACKPKFGSDNYKSVRVRDNYGNVFDSLRDYARFYNIRPETVTRRLKKRNNIEVV